MIMSKRQKLFTLIYIKKKIQLQYFFKLISNIVFRIKDKMFAFIYDPQQRIYTVPRLE